MDGPSSGQPVVEVNSTENDDKQDESNEVASLGELFQYATALDYFMMFIAALFSGVVGAAQPGIMILFADVMTAAANGQAGQLGDALLNTFEEITIKMVVLGSVCFVAAWFGDSLFRVTGLRQSSCWRKKYLSAIIRQDVGWYDTNKPNELSSRIAESTQQLEEGISDKLNLLFRFLFQGIVGIGVAFYYSWDMTLVLMALSPLVAFGTWFMTKATGEAAGLRATAYAKAGGVASETLSELRTVAALGAEEKQSQKYVSRLEEAKKAGVRSAARIGFANGIMFSSGNFMAAVGFIYGSFKIAKELERTTEGSYNCRNAPANLIDDGTIEKCRFDGGDIIIALFALQMGAQGLGTVQPSIMALAKARKAAFEILKVVSRTLIIDPFSDEVPLSLTRRAPCLCLCARAPLRERPESTEATDRGKATDRGDRSKRASRSELATALLGLTAGRPRSDAGCSVAAAASGQPSPPLISARTKHLMVVV